jgi:hypothetical protein
MEPTSEESELRERDVEVTTPAYVRRVLIACCALLALVALSGVAMTTCAGARR